GCKRQETVKATTEVLLRIKNEDPALLSRMTGLHLRVLVREQDAWKERSELTLMKPQLKWPLDIPILPRGGSSMTAQFQAVADALGKTEGSNKTEVLAQASVLARFTKNKVWLAELSLYVCPDHDLGYVCSEQCDGAPCATCALDGTCQETKLAE